MRVFLPALAAVVLAGCTTAAGPTPIPSQSAVPSPSATPFAIGVLPPEEPPEVRTAIPGQGVCFLVVVTNDGGSSSPVAIGAEAVGATIRSIEPATIAMGTTGEVWVVPDPTAVEATARVAITATRDGLTQTIERSLPVFPMADERAADAQPYFDRWLSWIIARHPELGITGATVWSPEFVSTLLVVSHYAWWSEDWEVTVLWHNMIAPYDWTEIQLRHRWTESAPSLAFRIDSVSGETEPYAVEPPAVVVR